MAEMVGEPLRVGFLVTPVGLMMGNVESARRLEKALTAIGVEVESGDDFDSCDLLHVHTPVPLRNFRVVRRAKRLGIPVVIHAHTTAEDSVGTWSGSELLSGMTGAYLTRFYNLADLVLAPSEWTKARLQARGVRVPIRVLSNGVDLSRFRPDQKRRERFRQEHGIPQDRRVVYSVGVMCLKKGIETFPDVASSVPEADFVWVGRTSKLYHPARVGRAMKRSGRNVRFLHGVEDILDAHCAGDIFFTPSHAENQGMALMEAMAVGRPVVARGLPAYDGLVENGRSALTGGGVEEFVKAIRMLLDSPRLADSLKTSASEKIRSHDIGNVARSLEAIYRSLLGSGDSHGGADT